MANNTTPVARVIRAGATRSPCIPPIQIRQPCLVLRIRIRPRRARATPTTASQAHPSARDTMQSAGDVYIVSTDFWLCREESGPTGVGAHHDRDVHIMIMMLEPYSVARSPHDCIACSHACASLLHPIARRAHGRWLITSNHKRVMDLRQIPCLRFLDCLLF